MGFVERFLGSLDRFMGERYGKRSRVEKETISTTTEAEVEALRRIVGGDVDGSQDTT